jgi:ATP-dependent helicase/nuclease subunit A
VVDFKTGRRVPASLAQVPPYHLRQMAAYSAALGVIFPGRRVEAALLYTAGPTLIALPADKPDLAATEQSLPSRA